MVRGLEVFQAHFQPYTDRYVLIGGIACLLNMDAAGLEFRVTKDLDIVLCVEVLDTEFVQTFWDFIQQGRYQHQQKSNGMKLFYRFHDPEDTRYPLMLELFSRTPDALTVQPGSHLTPIPVDEDVSSLSAILLDEDYYSVIHAGTQEIQGLPVVIPEYLIPLKARAWLDLTRRRESGEHVDDRDVRKHRNDVFRLYQLLTLDAAVVLAKAIREDMSRFLQKTEEAGNIDLRSLGLKTTLSEACANMRRIYRL